MTSFFTALLNIISVPVASAHEVYVLSPAEISSAVSAPPFDMFAVMRDNIGAVAIWGLITLAVIALVMWISRLAVLERWLDPLFAKVRRYAPTIARISIGASYLAGAYYQATFGPELPISNFGRLAPFITALLVLIGVMIILGIWTRIAAAVGLALFGIAAWMHGWYMLTYVNYLGELIVLLTLGGHEFSIDKLLAGRSTAPAKPARGASWSFGALRVLFGVALIYASAYAKIIHNNLALMTVQQYHLDKLLGFEPHFLVTGAAIIELLIGLFFIFGIEIRFTSLFFLFWLTLSLIFFGEAVWPHIMLIGIPIAYICYGYDGTSLEGYFFRKKPYPPVL